MPGDGKDIPIRLVLRYSARPCQLELTKNRLLDVRDCVLCAIESPNHRNQPKKLRLATIENRRLGWYEALIHQKFMKS